MRSVRCAVICVLTTWIACAISSAAASTKSSLAVDLLKGESPVFAIAGTEPPVWQDEILFNKEGKTGLLARWTFDVADIAAYIAVELEKSLDADLWRLNGVPVPVPLNGMRYTRIPAIPATMLRQGKNMLEAEWSVHVRKKDDKLAPARAELQARLFPLTAVDLDFQTGPVLGYADTNLFTVSCRTRLPATVTLEVDGRQQTSNCGLLHSFKVNGLKPETVYSYSLTAKLPGEACKKTIGPFTTRTLSGREPFTFVGLGDSRSHPQDWASVAAAVLEAHPAFVLFSGDMVADGREDHLWDEQFFGVAKAYFATVPTFYVLGNHEHNSPLFHRLIATPAVTSNWTSIAGPVLLIGINGELNWSDKSNNIQWLDRVLADSRAKFIFLVTHYPGWTSGGHGVLQSGLPRERTVHEAQRFILPTLKKYDATAMIAGHDHFYERSEPPDGVTVIITGGAGAPLYRKVENAQTQNPYSKAFASKLHFCIFSVEGDQCGLRVLTPEGEELDSRAWQARKIR